MGGRGASFANPSSGKWSKGPIPQLPVSMKEAIGKRGAPKSLGDAVVATNPHHSYAYKEFSRNCQRCVVAYELRRRGFDVTAQPTYRGDTLNKIAHIDAKANIYAARWRGAFRAAKTENVGVPGNKTAAEKAVIKNIENKMHSYGHGARAVVQILYRGGGGHVFNVENQDGRIVYVEAQSGELKNIESTMQSVKTGSVNIIRIDHLKLSNRIKDFVWQEEQNT